MGVRHVETDMESITLVLTSIHFLLKYAIDKVNDYQKTFNKIK